MKGHILVASILMFITNFVYAENNRFVKNIVADKAPHSLGAYSQGTSVDLSKGKLLYVSGQIAIDPKTFLEFAESQIFSMN